MYFVPPYLIYDVIYACNCKKQCFIFGIVVLLMLLCNNKKHHTYMDKISSYGFMAEPFQCDFDKHLFMGILCNQLLNAADYHAHERNMGMKQLNVDSKTWVLSRFSLLIDKMPVMYDKYTITTWVDSIKRFFTHRNFEIKNDEGERYALASTVWAMIDVETRQPVNLATYKDGYIMQCYTEDYGSGVKSSRVTLGDNLELKGEHVVRYSDLDPNGHVNSMKYIDHVFDILPPSWFKQHTPKLLEVAFVAEGYYGDTLRFYCNAEENAYNFSIKSLRENEEIEVCRCRIEF